jgi:uncharacterized tellurite resistance protein B-like protein
MHSYPRNSPQAAIRIVALTLLADGHVNATELANLQRLADAGRFGPQPPDVSGIVRDTVLDLLATGGAAWSGGDHLDETMVEGLLSEIDDPRLRGEVLALCHAAAVADRHVSDGEKAFLAVMADRWQMPAGARA